MIKLDQKKIKQVLNSLQCEVVFQNTKSQNYVRGFITSPEGTSIGRITFYCGLYDQTKWYSSCGCADIINSFDKRVDEIKDIIEKENVFREVLRNNLFQIKNNKVSRFCIFKNSFKNSFKNIFKFKDKNVRF